MELLNQCNKKKRPKHGALKNGLLIATDTVKNKPIAGALVSGENEEETIFFLLALREWLSTPVKFMTIDFSSPLLKS